MSETSRSRVTITLGRSGQVVKRDGSRFDSLNNESMPVVGSKRPIRERLGNSSDSAAPLYNKRLKKDDMATTAVDGIRLRNGDLRYKIMQKNMFKKSLNRHRNEVDLRNVLSRPAQSSTNSISTHAKMPEEHYFESKERRRYISEPRDSRHMTPITKSSNQQSSVSRAQPLRDSGVRQLPGGRDGGRTILVPDNVRHHMLDHSSVMSGVPGRRSTNDVTKMEYRMDSFSPWTLDRLRRKSPDEALTTSRALSAPMREEGSQRGFAVRALAEARSSAYKGKDVFEYPRPTSSSSYLSKRAVPVGSTKAMTPLISMRHTSNNPERSNAVGDTTVDMFLRSLGLEKYAIFFKAEEVDMYSLNRMSDGDLKEMGIPMGPRKKILLSLQPRHKRLE